MNNRAGTMNKYHERGGKHVTFPPAGNSLPTCWALAEPTSLRVERDCVHASEVSRRGLGRGGKKVLGRTGHSATNHGVIPRLMRSAGVLGRTGQFATNNRVGFTLAEVLITLGIIGVVAAITIPTLVQSVAERSNSEKEANTVQKINKSMDLMRADGKLMVQYESTDKFVDELVKYLRVTTRCDANNIAKCWPTAKVITSDGEEYEVKNAKTGKNLNLKNNKTNNVGLILNDGTPLIVSYNENSALISDGDTVSPSKKSLPIGFGKTKEFVYGSSVMAPIDFVMDVNGFRGPNSETRNGKLYDIRSYSVARFSKGASCPTGEITVGSKSYCNLGTSYNPVNCSDSSSSEYKYCGSNPSGYDTDYWAGAKKACEDAGYTLPDKDTLKKIRATAWANTSSGLPTTGYFWSSTEYDTYAAYYVFFSGGSPDGYDKTTYNGALCLGN